MSRDGLHREVSVAELYRRDGLPGSVSPARQRAPRPPARSMISSWVLEVNEAVDR